MIIDKTENPIVLKTGGHWCQKVSPGCLNCYAERMNNQSQFSFASHLPYTGVPPEMILKEDMLNAWKSARKQKVRFIGNMTDIFGEWVPEEWQFKLLDTMRSAPLQTFLLLTKRPVIMKNVVSKWCEYNQIDSLPENIWCGTTIECQSIVFERSRALSETKCQHKWLSVEPLLESVQLSLEGIHYVHVGGETGEGARICDLAWLQSVVLQCERSGVSVDVAQLGSQPFLRGYPFKNRVPYSTSLAEWLRML